MADLSKTINEIKKVSDKHRKKEDELRVRDKEREAENTRTSRDFF